MVSFHWLLAPHERVRFWVVLPPPRSKPEADPHEYCALALYRNDGADMFSVPSLVMLWMPELQNGEETINVLLHCHIREKGVNVR